MTPCGLQNTWCRGQGKFWTGKLRPVRLTGAAPPARIFPSGRMGPERRLAMMFQAETFARTLMRAGAKCRHPDWTEAEVEREIARLRADAKDLSDVWKAVLSRSKPR